MRSMRFFAGVLLAVTLISVPVYGNEKVVKPAEHAQVIVVGAGLAGMTGALSLARKGIDVILLEKEDAVGGRVNSPLLGGVAVNLGAQYYFPGLHPILRRIPEITSCAGA